MAKNASMVRYGGVAELGYKQTVLLVPASNLIAREPLTTGARSPPFERSEYTEAWLSG